MSWNNDSRLQRLGGTSGFAAAVDFGPHREERLKQLTDFEAQQRFRS